MPNSLVGARVLVAVPDADDPPDSADVTGLTGELGIEVVTKRGAMAIEYLRELGPTVECVICVGDCASWVGDISEAAPSVPIVVYADDAPSAPVDGIVARDGGTGVLAARVTDEIRRGRERDRLDEANAKLNALNSYTRGITACETPEDVTDRVVSAVTDALAYDRCVLGLREGDDIVPYGNTLHEEGSVRFKTDEGIAGLTLRTGETQIVGDYQSHSMQRRDTDRVKSVLSVPVGDHGVLQVTDDEYDAFDERDAEFLEIVGSHAREALSRLRRETDLRIERDRLHAFFEGLPAPTVYVEADEAESIVLRDANAAYEDAFPDAPVGAPVDEAFPTDAERALVRESIRADGSVTERIRRDTAATPDCELYVTLVPVQTAGLEAAGFVVYVTGVSLP